MTHNYTCRAIKRWHTRVGSAQLTAEQKSQLQSTVKDSFQVTLMCVCGIVCGNRGIYPGVFVQEWLTKNGFDRDIVGLSVRDTATSQPPTHLSISTTP